MYSYIINASEITSNTHLGPPRSRRKDGIKCARNVFGEMPIRGNGGGARRTKNHQGHMKADPEKERGKEDQVANLRQ